MIRNVKEEDLELIKKANPNACFDRIDYSMSYITIEDGDVLAYFFAVGNEFPEVMKGYKGYQPVEVTDIWGKNSDAVTITFAQGMNFYKLASFYYLYKTDYNAVIFDNITHMGKARTRNGKEFYYIDNKYRFKT